jgi:hypothetical protein
MEEPRQVLKEDFTSGGIGQNRQFESRAQLEFGLRQDDTGNLAQALAKFFTQAWVIERFAVDQVLEYDFALAAGVDRDRPNASVGMALVSGHQEARGLPATPVLDKAAQGAPSIQCGEYAMNSLGRLCALKLLQECVPQRRVLTRWGIRDLAANRVLPDACQLCQFFGTDSKCTPSCRRRSDGYVSGRATGTQGIPTRRPAAPGERSVHRGWPGACRRAQRGCR